MTTQLERKQKELLFKLEEKTNVPYMLLKKLLKNAEANSTGETSEKERLEEYRSLINIGFNKEKK
ncbi:hypothetical protein [Kurthia zopfii]|uniref:hypothetical protein n=1 Tax=Kurthia zopfii TaxID=1650 RepID=UPI000F6E9C2E|nr:hypothetical protein [Kurthia zopfii]VEI08066.1 Uncharacterised protein [Kurthia zopfii]